MIGNKCSVRCRLVRSSCLPQLVKVAKFQFESGANGEPDRVISPPVPQPTPSPFTTDNKDRAHNRNYFCLLIFNPSRESWKINSINQAGPQIPVTAKVHLLNNQY